MKTMNLLYLYILKIINLNRIKKLNTDLSDYEKEVKNIISKMYLYYM